MSKKLLTDSTSSIKKKFLSHPDTKSTATTDSTSKILKKIRLSTVLVVPFIIPIITSTGLVGWFSFRNAQRAINDLANQLNSEISARIEQHVLGYLDKSHNILRVTDAGVQSGKFQLNDFQGLHRYFWQVVKQGDLESYLSFGNEQGEFVGVEHQEDGSIQLKIRTINTEPIRNTYLLDTQSNRQKLLKQAEYDPRTRPWYKAAKQAEKPTWSPIYPFFSRQNASLGISPVRPVYDSQSKLIGVLCINITLMRITDFLKTLYISPQGQSFIMERSGDLVVSSTITDPFIVTEGKGEEDREIERMSAMASQNATVTATAQHLRDRFGNFNAIANSQQLQFQIDGTWHYAQVLPIQDGRGIDWLAVVVVPENDFMEQISANTRTTILLCAITFIVSTAIGILTARWISGQIFQLNQASQSIASGDLKQSVKVNGIVEIENLAGSFNSMAHQLEESFTALEAKNEALRIAEENYRGIYENALEGIFQSSVDGQYLSVNPAMARLYGYDSPEDMVASVRKIGEQIYVDPTVRYDFQHLMQEQGEVKGFEYQAFQRDGNIIWVEENTHVVRDNSGNLLYYEGIIQDITDRKRKEAALQRQLQELQIEINQKKREQEVKKITQSDYFKELKAAAESFKADDFWT